MEPGGPMVRRRPVFGCKTANTCETTIGQQAQSLNCDHLGLGPYACRSRDGGVEVTPSVNCHVCLALRTLISS